jgi:hypothetical protein
MCYNRLASNNNRIDVHRYFKCIGCKKTTPFCLLYESYNKYDPDGFLLLCAPCEFIRVEDIYTEWLKQW